MIYFYKHKGLSELNQQEIDFLGFNGVKQFAQENNLDANMVFSQIKALEADIKNLNGEQFDVSSGKNLELLNKSVNEYIKFFNKNSRFDKQAYILIGNIASGKSTYAKQIEDSTHSIIIDPDRYKMGENTENGYFEGLTSLYKEPTDRERMQDPCSIANKMTLDLVSNCGMNLIMPKAATSLEKLERQLDILTRRNYDIHLILVETPLTDCADRNYYRYLVKEYSKKGNEHGRFVPVSVITNIGDGSYQTFVKAMNGKRFKSFKALYSEGLTKNSNFEEIDIKTLE